MNQTLSYVLGRRMWWVSGVSVWGDLAAFEPEFIVSEATPSGYRILHASYSFGGETQTLRYADLVDIKGNRLPDTLKRPRVIPVNKSASAAIIQGEEQSDSFKVARIGAGASQGATPIDLLIIEMGD